jgi:uncharacterized protein with HEPN domain
VTGSRLGLADLLQSIFGAIERINEDVGHLAKPEFLAESREGRQVRDTVVLNLGTMGEAANSIRTHFPEFARSHPEIPLQRMWDMRGHLFHGYHSVNYEIVWTTCRSAIPVLERQVHAAIKEIAGEAS